MSGTLFACPIEQDFEDLEGHVSFTKIKRYRRGVVPDWFVHNKNRKITNSNESFPDVEACKQNRTTKIHNPVIVSHKPDERLTRLRQTEKIPKEDSKHHQFIYNTKIVETPYLTKSEKKSVNEDNIENIIIRRKE